jgi:integrase
VTPLRRLARLGFTTVLLEHVVFRLDPLDDYSGFDLLLQNVQGALVALSRYLPSSLPAPLLDLIPVLSGINTFVAKEGIGTIATASDSGRDDVANSTYGKFNNHPIYAAFAEDCSSLPKKLRERICLCYGLLLLARLGLHAPSTASRKEVEVAEGLRKSVGNDAWFAVLEAIPEAGPHFMEQLRALNRHDRKFADLAVGQRDFLRVLASLGNVLWRTAGAPPVHGIDRRILDDDESGDTPSVRRVCHHLYKPGDDSDAEEGAVFLEYVETLPTPANDAGKFLECRARSLASFAIQRFARDNQFLPNRWRALTDQEAVEFVAAAHSALSANAQPDSRCRALVSSLVFITSHAPSALANFVLVENLDVSLLGTCMSEHVIDVAQGVWWHMWPTLPGRFLPDRHQTPLLNPNTDWIPLPLPTVICAALELGGGPPTLLAQRLQFTSLELEALHAEFCQFLRKGANRTSSARVRAHGFDYLMRQTGDDTFASAVQGTVEYAPYSPLYYFACRAEDAIAFHTSRLKAVGWTVQPAPHIMADNVRFGSRLQPSTLTLQDLVRQLSGDLANAHIAYGAGQSPETIARVHNAISKFTAAMAISATGHRQAKEYSFARWTLDLYNSQLMVADKILSTASSVRQVSIPQILAKQFNAYLLHLEFLAAKMTRYHPTLAAQIRTLTEPDAGSDSIPLLFLLSNDLTELTPLSHEVLKASVGNAWPLPWNAARHLLEVETRVRGLSAEFNHYRAGHVSTGQQPYSPNSPLIPELVIARSAEIVDQVLEEQGWVVQAGLSGRRRTSGHFERLSVSRITEPYLPAPIQKAQSLTRESSVKVVNAAIAQVKKALGKQTALDDDAVESIRQEILNVSIEHPFLVAERLNLLRMMLGTRRKTGEFRIRSLPGMAAQYDEKPTFEPDAAWRVRQAVALRQGFLDILALHPSQSFEDALERIVFGLIAFSAFTAVKTVAPALQACFSSAFTLDNCLWIDFPRRPEGADEDVREWIRRPLDPITTCLILTCRTKFGTDLPANFSTEDAIQRGALHITRLAAQQARLPVELPKTLNNICSAFIPYWRFHLSGIHAAWCEGRIVSVSMDRVDFLRAMTGQRPVDPGKPPNIDIPKIAMSARPEHMPQAFIKVRKLMRRIGQILISARPSSVTGGKDSGHYAYKMQKANDDLARFSPLLAHSPVVLKAISAWVKNLIDQGGVLKGRLQMSSIATYYWSIAYPLLEFFFEEDMAALDSAALEDLYSESLDARSPRTRIKRARVLRQFHLFCVATYGFADVDWYEIEPLIDAEAGYIDANIVTPGEYAKAMSVLKPYIETANMSALKLSILMLLMYRAGLRLGEAFRLTLDDFVLDGKTFILFVRGNRYGKPKTGSGRRQIHLGWRLLAEERVLIEQLITYRRSLCGEAQEVALFGSTAIAHDLDVRRVLEQDLVELLRWATGRWVVRPHHLRHTMGSFCTVSQFELPAASYFAQSVSEYFCGAENPGAALRLALLGHPDASRRIMYAICAETGHASPSTLISVYANCLDAALASRLWASDKETLGDRDESNETGIGQRSAQNINMYARAAALSGLSDSRLRRFRHDGVDVTDPVVLAKYLLDQHPIGHGIAFVDPAALPAYQPRWAHRDQLTLEQLHGVIAAHVNGSEIGRIAEAWAITEDKVRQLVAAARALAATCRYNNYGMKSLSNAWLEDGVRSLTKPTPRIPSSKRDGDTFDMFGYALVHLDDPVVRRGLRAWVRSYRPTLHGFASADPRDFEAFWTLLCRLGYSTERIVIALPLMTAQNRKVFQTKLQAMGIQSKNIEYMDSEYLGADHESGSIVPVILVKRNGDSKIQPAALAMKMLHQCCYLCAVALELESGSRESGSRES